MRLSEQLRGPLDKDHFYVLCDAVEEMEIRSGELELDIQSGDINYKELVESFDKMVKTYSKTISRRDQFAMAALSGVIINGWTEKDAGEIVRNTVRLADALIKELDK